MSAAERFAPSGAIWVCGACGKTARDQWGIEGSRDAGWDESCMLNSILCDAATLVRSDGGYGRVIKADPFRPPVQPNDIPTTAPAPRALRHTEEKT